MTNRIETDKKWLLQEDPNADDSNSQWSLSLPTTLSTGFPGSLGRPLALGRLLYLCKLLYRGSALQMYYANAQCTQAHSVPVPSVCMVAPAYQEHSREFKVTDTRRPMVYQVLSPCCHGKKPSQPEQMLIAEHHNPYTKCCCSKELYISHSHPQGGTDVSCEILRVATPQSRQGS